MPSTQDNWERLVAAVLRKEQLWELFHAHSRSPSVLSDASDLSSSSRSNFALDDVSIDFSVAGSSSSIQQQHPPFVAKSRNPVLVFTDGVWPDFGLEDLFLSSAEALGKGTFGSVYSAKLDNGMSIIVKRLKLFGITEQDFKRRMQDVGNVRHPNVAPLRAYYTSEEEKLVLYDHHSSGSMFELLHGENGKHGARVDWATRLRIAIGAARGISHIHAQSGGKLVHGNIKGDRGSGGIHIDWKTRLDIAVGAARGIAHIHTRNDGKLVLGNIRTSNIFLDEQKNTVVSDVGLANLSSPIRSSVMWNEGDCAPEVIDTKLVSQASDVYSFGVVLLELVSGKSPRRTIYSDEGVPLVRWITFVIRQEWTTEVIDFELLRYKNVEEAVVQILQIALACVAKDPESRPEMAEVVTRLEEISGSETVLF